MLTAMLRKTLKTLAWIVGSLIGAVAAIYLVAVAVNWRDQPPSPDALSLLGSYETRPSLVDDDNAFIYLFGFDAPLSDDPQDLGQRRLAWLRSTIGASLDLSDDPQTEPLEYTSADPRVEQFVQACTSDTIHSRECAIAFAEGGVIVEAWNASQPWLLERYRELIAHSGWREEVFGSWAPFPGYAPALRGQRLLLSQVKVLADNGDARGASELLARDARFWRMVLGSSDMLITKMIATAALRQHFALGSIAMRNLPAASVAEGIPREWREPLNDSELSLRRVLVGEWVYFSNAPALEYSYLADGETLAARMSDRLLRPIFQPQDTLNRHAAYLNALADALEAPLSGYASAADRADRLAWRTADEAFPPRSLYNVVGALVMAAGPAEYGDYALRVGDLEGMRRGALATVLLRGGAIPTSQISEALAASPLRNPYDDEPLRWDAEERAVVFVGLEPGQRGEHRYYY